MVYCKKFSMYNLSISMLFGKSPKISYICGSCGSYNEGRIPVQAIKFEKPYLKCEFCKETNIIPIRFPKEYQNI